jgi:hypothetical protein
LESYLLEYGAAFSNLVSVNSRRIVSWFHGEQPRICVVKTKSSYYVVGALITFLIAALNLDGALSSPPVIIDQPRSQDVAAGSTVSFGVSASGTEPLVFQWQFNGTNLVDGGRISGATTATLTLSDVRTNDAGTYGLLITNEVSAVPSTVATLVVGLPPAIAKQPANQEIVVGGIARFSATVTGSSPLLFQWQYNGANLVDDDRITGGNTTTLVINNAQTHDTGNYSLIVTNRYNAITSSVATLMVGRPPQMVTPPANQEGPAGTNINFSVDAAGTSPLSYQWRKNNTNLVNNSRISGASAPTLSIANLQPADAGNYQVIVTNRFGTNTSPVATLMVLGPPVIIGQPASQTVALGSNANFTLLATGTPPLGYQWLVNGSDLKEGTKFSGANSNTLGVGNVTIDDLANYTVIVTNSLGRATSDVARLTVTSSNLLYQTGFEAGEGFQLGKGLTNQSGWVGDGDGTNGIRAGMMPGLGQQAFIGGGTASLSQGSMGVWHPISTGIATNAVVEFTAWLRIEDSNNGEYDEFQWMADRPQDSYFIIDFDNSNNEVWYYLSEDADWHPSSVSFENGRTYRLKVSMDFGRNRWSAWLDETAMMSEEKITNLKKPYGLSDIGARWVAADNTRPGDNYMVFDEYRIELLREPVIKKQPQSVSVVEGNRIRLEAEAAGGGTLRYQWWLNGTHAPAGATNTVLDLVNIQPADAGDYTLVASNAYGSITSVVARVQVVSAGLFYETHFEPDEGFTIGASLADQSGWSIEGSPDNGVTSGIFAGLGQQAFVGSRDTAGATNDYTYAGYNFNMTFVPTNVVVRFSTLMQITDSTNRVYDDFTWTVSGQKNVYLSLDFANQDWSVYYRTLGEWHPANVSFENGVLYELDLVLDFTANLWSGWLSGKPLALDQSLAANNRLSGLDQIAASWYPVSPTKRGDNRLYFDNYRLELLQAPVIIMPPQGGSVPTGDPFSFRVVAAGVNPLRYQWRKEGRALVDGDKISGVNSASLNLQGVAAADAGFYSVTISNLFGGLDSQPVELKVLPNRGPRLQQIRLIDGQLAFQIPSVAGVRYVTEYKEQLNEGEPWKILSSNYGKTNFMEIIDFPLTNQNSRFYRVRLE